MAKITSSLIAWALLLSQSTAHQSVLGPSLPHPSSAANTDAKPYTHHHHVDSTSSPFDSRFAAKVNETLHRLHIPGLAIAVVQDDEIFAEGYGIATFPDTPVRPETLFYSGSTTKAFTAGAVSLLVDNKTVEWTTPLSHLIRDEFVLEDEYTTTHATFEDALSHRTGLPRHDLTVGASNTSTSETVVRNLRHLPMTAEPRTRLQYCNLMYITVGYIVERLTGMPLGDFLHSRIWAPLNMTGTYFSLSDARESTHDLAQGYDWDNRTAEYHTIPHPLSGFAAGAGDIISNVVDYGKWLRSMIHRSPPLSEAGHAAVILPRSIAGPAPEPLGPGDMTYAFGWMKVMYRGELVIAHDGGIWGFGALALFMPERKMGIAVMANTMITSNVAANALAYYLIDGMLGVPEEERFDWLHAYDERTNREDLEFKNATSRLYPSVPSPPIPAALPPSAYQGRYTHPAYPTVTLETITPENNAGSKDTETRLRGSIESVLFDTKLELEHVSGEFWLASIAMFEAENWKEKFRAEFRLDAQGKVKELGMELDQEMAAKGQKIWMTREV